uniref:BURP domain-containing protein n=1 Tax=Leersia perrieri TaxID=77586 RepID=A0A0D9WE02_9ORYZ
MSYMFVFLLLGPTINSLPIDVSTIIFCSAALLISHLSVNQNTCSLVTMARPIAALLLLLVAAAEASHGAATTPAELYWKIALPTSPMPGAIRDLINNPAMRLSGSVSSSQDEDTAVGSVFFLEKDLFPGSKMTLRFTRATAGAPLLPRGRADAIPFASDKLPQILSRLSVPAGSPAADAMRATLAECEAAPQAGEAKRCATSLESMAFAVELAGEDGSTRVEAVAACHADAAPGVAEAYKRLGVAPGSVPVCHFLPQDDMLWLRN